MRAPRAGGVFREILAAAAAAAAVCTALAIMFGAVNGRLDAIDSRLVDVERRVTHIETMVELLTDRVLPWGGAPARSDEFGGAPCDDGLPAGQSVTLIGAPPIDCVEEAR